MYRKHLLKSLIILLSVTGLIFIYACTGSPANEPGPLLTYCNPLDLEYRYQPDLPSRRESADPTVILFGDKYFLFASKTGGYWWSDDLFNWNLVETEDIPIEDYAPTAIVIGDTVYFMASSARRTSIYKSVDPVSGSWQVACDTFAFAVWDPAFFLDEDERLYLYWGCSNANPIYGIEVDYKNNFKPVGIPVECFNARTDIHGWERPGDRNELQQSPWIEGAWMNKYRGTYYLQYAGPGTEFKSYADGVYLSDHPLGPFRYASHNPFSIKAGGFSCGAGHGSTFTDRYGNLWHIATVSISVNHMFERRLALFPTMFDEDKHLYTHTGFGDYPFLIPDHKTSDPNELFTGWMLLSYNKPVRTSGALKDHPAKNAVDEEIRTVWSAESGSGGEWMSVDLEKEFEIRALQLNFADVSGTFLTGDSECHYQFTLEYSHDGENWKMLDDQSTTRNNSPHYFLQLHRPVRSRFVRLSNHYFPGEYFSVSGLRIFGTGDYEKPGIPDPLTVMRDETDRAIARISWNHSTLSSGHNLRYGISPDKLYHQHLVYADTSLILRSLDADTRYYFTIDAFNESGITPSGSIVTLE